jgi:DNA-binding MarR family transcriptional regulator
MVNIETFERLDGVIHERSRLRIMTLLAANESLSFKELKEHTGMTDGNLSVHMRTLEESGYVTVRKSFVNRKPRTEYALSPEGREAFTAYIETLAEIVKQSQQVEAAARPAESAREVHGVLKPGIAGA